MLGRASLKSVGIAPQSVGRASHKKRLSIPKMTRLKCQRRPKIKSNLKSTALKGLKVHDIQKMVM